MGKSLSQLTPGHPSTRPPALPPESLTHAPLHSPERCSHLPKVTQLVSMRAAEAMCWTPGLCWGGRTSPGGHVPEKISRIHWCVHSFIHGLCLVEDLMFLEDVDCAVYFCVSQIPWRLEVLHIEWAKHA